jgi:hypothetical protein
MKIAIKCEDCGQRYAVPDSLSGKSVKCKHCGSAIAIRDITAEPTPPSPFGDVSGVASALDEEIAQVAPIRESSPAAYSAPPYLFGTDTFGSDPFGNGDSADDWSTLSADSPAHQSIFQRFFSTYRLQFSGWGLVIGFLGIGGILWAVAEFRLARMAKAVPQEMTVEKLLAEGPGDNAHVKLTDVFACNNAYLYEYKERQEGWSKVWVPLVARGGQYHLEFEAAVEKVINELAEEFAKTGEQPQAKVIEAIEQRAEDLPPPRDLRIILVSDRYRTEEDVGALDERNAFRGILVNEIESLNSDAQKLLSESYPQVDLNNCYILEEGRTLSGVGAQAGALLFGLLAFAIGVSMFVEYRDK